MSKVYIVAAKRSAVGSFSGAFNSLSPAGLGAAVLKDLLATAKVPAAAIDEVMVGNVLSAGHKQGIARQVSIHAEVPAEVPAWGINMICGSGMKSVMNAAQVIASGNADLVVAGGVENMSQAAFALPAVVRAGQKMGDLTMVDTMISDGLTDAFHNFHMGITAENIAEKYNISREAQDAFAYASQQKAIKAVDSGAFKNEITPIEVKTRKETITVDTDEYPNRKSSLEKLAGLRPAFKKDGSVTAGNASGLNDGAAFLLVASEEAVKKHNLTPLVEIVGMGQGGVDPKVMGLGPTPAIAKALKQANLTLKDIDVIELNEAFAVQSLGVIHELKAAHGVDDAWFNERTNLLGGAIALGHPIGASGARITVTLIHQMLNGNHTHGLASLCIGGGMGTALILKKV